MILGPNGQPISSLPIRRLPRWRWRRRVELLAGVLLGLLVFLVLQAVSPISQGPVIDRENAESTYREAEAYVLQTSEANWDLQEANDARRHLVQSRHLLDRGDLDGARHQAKIAQARAEAGWVILEARGQEDLERAHRAFALANEVVPSILWKRTFTAERAHSYWTAARFATNPLDRERFANWALEAAGWADQDNTNWQPMPPGWFPPMPPPTLGHDGRG